MGALYDGKRYLVESFSVAVTPSLRLIAPRPLDVQGSRILLAGLSEGVQGFAPLANVPREIESVHALHGGEVLLNEKFRGDRFAEALRERPPGIVHIASHAEFTGRPETSYVLAYDRKLTMPDLSRLIPIALCVLIVVLGAVSAMAALAQRNTEEQPPPRTADITMVDAMTNARPPMLSLIGNPIVGVIGVLIGAKLRGGGKPDGGAPA